MTALTLRLESYAPDARVLVQSAQALADARKHAEVTPAHVFYRLVEESDAVGDALRRAGVDPVDVLVELEAAIRKTPGANDNVAYLSPRTLELLGRAEAEASRARGAPVGVLELLLASAQELDGPVRDVLRFTGLSAPLVRAAVDTVRATGGRHGAANAIAGTVPSLIEGSPATPKAIAEFSVDWTHLAARGELGPTIGRDAELRRMVQVLARHHENNPLLVGEPGIGKRSIVRQLALRMAHGDVPTLLSGKRLVALDLGALVAGARLRGQLEERVKAFLGAVRDLSGEVVVFLPNLAPLVGEHAAAGDLLASALGRGELRAVAVATPEAFKKARDQGQELLRRFVPIDVEPATVDGTVTVLRGLVEGFEAAHGVRVGDPAVVAAAKLARRYVPSVALPKAAVDLLDEASALVRVTVESVPTELDALERRRTNLTAERRSLLDDTDPDSKDALAKIDAEVAALSPRIDTLHADWQRDLALLGAVRNAREEVHAAELELERAKGHGDDARARELSGSVLAGLERRLVEAEASLEATGSPLANFSVLPEHVAEVVAAWTGVPVAKMLEGEADKLLRMEASLGTRVVGQDAAVGAISRAVRRGRVGLRDPRKPIGSFLFLGPSGVGKTELAKALAEFLFDDEHALTRLDMSEFMEKHMVARLLGSPPGYADSDEGGFLTEAVRRRPYSVILFDEVEKAHPDVFNILLQVLDDGRLTDSRGRMAHFEDTVIILTSNIGSRLILDHDGTPDALRTLVEKELHASFRPEFLNRIDDVVLFDPLSHGDLGRIVEIQLRGLESLLAPRRVSLTLSDAAKAELVRLGYEPAFGARPLKRVIMKKLQDPLAEQLLRGAFTAGDVVHVDVNDGAFTFAKKSPR